MGKLSIPPWMMSKLDQRIALLKETFDHVPEFRRSTETILLLLTEPDPTMTAEQAAAWETACDNCGSQEGDKILSLQVTTKYRRHPVVIVIGACANCMKGHDGSDAG